MTIDEAVEKIFEMGKDGFSQDELRDILTAVVAQLVADWGKNETRNNN